MLTYLDGVTTQLINKSLDLCMHRHQLIANNVANANAKDFKALSLDESSAISFLENIFNGDMSENNKISFLKESKIQSKLLVSETNSSVALDEELVKLNKNIIHYQALLTAKKSYGEIMKLAVTGGR